MMNFKEFLQQTSLGPLKLPTLPSSAKAATGQEPWRAEKDEILTHWKSLPPNVPVGEVRTIPPKYRGPTFTFDGIRVTGSSNFINAVISRLKDLLTFESERTTLQTIYKQQVDKKSGNPIPESYVFYVQIKQQAPKQKKIR